MSHAIAGTTEKGQSQRLARPALSGVETTNRLQELRPRRRAHAAAVANCNHVKHEDVAKKQVVG